MSKLRCVVKALLVRVARIKALTSHPSDISSASQSASVLQVALFCVCLGFFVFCFFFKILYFPKFLVYSHLCFSWWLSCLSLKYSATRAHNLWCNFWLVLPAHGPYGMPRHMCCCLPVAGCFDDCYFRKDLTVSFYRWWYLRNHLCIVDWSVWGSLWPPRPTE